MSEKIKRNRNVAHLWCDKQVVRYFRKLWKQGVITVHQFQSIKSVYITLCEIESDNAEKRNTDNQLELTSLLKLLSSYSGVSGNVACKVMQCLRSFGLIDYGQIRNGKHAIGTYLEMYEYDQQTLDENVERALSIINKSIIIQGHTYADEYQNKNDTKVSDKTLLEKIGSCSSKSSRTKYPNKPKKEIPTAKQTKSIPEDNQEIINCLKRIVKKHYPNNKLPINVDTIWNKGINRLFKTWDGKIKDLHGMLKHYYIHYDKENKFHVVIRSADSLCDKIMQLERFCNAKEKNSTIEQPTTSTKYAGLCRTVSNNTQED